jgi:hypothetical protein
MDLLGFFKEEIRFLKIKIRLNPPPLYRSSHTGSPDRVWLGLQQPCAWPSHHWLPQRIRPGVVRPGAVQASMWPRREWLAAADPGGLATATPASGPPCTKRLLWFQRCPKVFDEMPLKRNGGAL